MSIGEVKRLMEGNGGEQRLVIFSNNNLQVVDEGRAERVVEHMKPDNAAHVVVVLRGIPNIPSFEASVRKSEFYEDLNALYNLIFNTDPSASPVTYQIVYANSSSALPIDRTPNKSKEIADRVYEVRILMNEANTAPLLPVRQADRQSRGANQRKIIRELVENAITYPDDNESRPTIADMLEEQSQARRVRAAADISQAVGESDERGANILFPLFESTLMPIFSQPPSDANLQAAIRTIETKLMKRSKYSLLMQWVNLLHSSVFVYTNRVAFVAWVDEIRINHFFRSMTTKYPEVEDTVVAVVGGATGPQEGEYISELIEDLLIDEDRYDLFIQWIQRMPKTFFTRISRPSFVKWVHEIRDSILSMSDRLREEHSRPNPDTEPAAFANVAVGSTTPEPVFWVQCDHCQQWRVTTFEVPDGEWRCGDEGMDTRGMPHVAKLVADLEDVNADIARSVADPGVDAAFVSLQRKLRRTRSRIQDELCGIGEENEDEVASRLGEYGTNVQVVNPEYIAQITEEDEQVDVGEEGARNAMIDVDGAVEYNARVRGQHDDDDDDEEKIAEPDASVEPILEPDASVEPIAEPDASVEPIPEPIPEPDAQVIPIAEERKHQRRALEIQDDQIDAIEQEIAYLVDSLPKKSVDQREDVLALINKLQGELQTKQGLHDRPVLKRNRSPPRSPPPPPPPTKRPHISVVSSFQLNE